MNRPTRMVVPLMAFMLLTAIGVQTGVATTSTPCVRCEPAGGGGITGPNAGWNCAAQGTGFKGCTMGGGQCSNFVWALCSMYTMKAPLTVDGTIVLVQSGGGPRVLDTESMDPNAAEYQRSCDGSVLSRRFGGAVAGVMAQRTQRIVL